MYEPLALLALFALVFSAVSGGLARTPVSGPMVFLAFGVLVGEQALGLIRIGGEAELLKGMAEVTLALVLFTDASSADFRVLRRFERLPVRLLLVGLPLTIALGYGVGVVLLGSLMAVELALLATMLAPTDAALGQAVVTNEAVPAPVRQGLNVESGLNDGICVPILFFFLHLARGGEDAGAGLALGLLAEEIGIGAGVGIGVTALGVGLLRLAHRRDWIGETWVQVPAVALAFSCLTLAQLLGGSGFIAAFVGGLFFGARAGEARERLVPGAEGLGGVLSLLTWVVFGAVVVGRGLGSVSWEVVLYALLSLTVIRMLPVFLCLTGLRASVEAKLFIGWFGPRGLASIVFGVIVLGENLPNGDVVRAVVVATVIFSIVAHGLTANAWARGFGAREAGR